MAAGERRHSVVTMPTTHHKNEAREGDWIEVSGRPGRHPRSGQILEILGRRGHEHYRVRWDESHESIFFPTEGPTVIRDPSDPGGQRAAR